MLFGSGVDAHFGGVHRIHFPQEVDDLVVDGGGTRVVAIGVVGGPDRLVKHRRHESRRRQVGGHVAEGIVAGAIAGAVHENHTGTSVPSPFRFADQHFDVLYLTGGRPFRFDGDVPFRHLVIAFFRQFFAGWIGEGHGGVGVKRFDGLLGRLVVPCGCRQIGHGHQNAQQHDENRQVDHESPPARPRLMLRLRTRGR